MDFWTIFHFGVALLIILYAIWDLRPLVGRQFLFGAEIHAGMLFASFLARFISGDPYPVLWYGLIDATAVSLYALIMFRKKAIWAAVCVLIQSVMLFMHPAYVAFGQINQKEYLWGLGIMTFLSALAIFIGTMAGRHEFGRGWDDFLSSHLHGWSWSGAVSSRIQTYKKQVG
ncbi:MAG: hypothetical protein KAH44_05565 [Oricola sp.]|jgi:hypothetical protein|nr:hypothetical protein [Oricola sp.]